jgi:integrase
VKTDYVPRDRWLTEVEYLALLDALPDHRRDYVRVAVYTGARKSELERLTWAEVDLKGGWIRIPGKKTERARRHIPIEAPLRRALETMPHRKGPLLALWGDIGHELPEAAIRAGMRPVTTNDLRRTFTSWALQNGANPFEVARLLGHASTKMVETVYGHLAARNLVRVVRRLPDPEGRTNNVRDSSGLKRKRKGS